jgi:hypothetical protein
MPIWENYKTRLQRVCDLRRRKFLSEFVISTKSQLLRDRWFLDVGILMVYGTALATVFEVAGDSGLASHSAVYRSGDAGKS